jgi:predicted nuclease of predicted toxin-antitoxin system
VTVRFLADENFNRKIVVGLQRRIEDLDLVRVQDVGLTTAEDPEVLESAAEHGRVLLTHDIQTVPDFAHQRVIAEQPMAGVIIVPALMALASAIEDLELIVGASLDGEWDNQVSYLPLR